MWVEQSHDAMVTGYARSQEEDTHTTNQRVDIASSWPTIAAKCTKINNKEGLDHELMHMYVYTLTCHLWIYVLQVPLMLWCVCVCPPPSLSLSLPPNLLLSLSLICSYLSSLVSLWMCTTILRVVWIWYTDRLCYPKCQQTLVEHVG